MAMKRSDAWDRFYGTMNRILPRWPRLEDEGCDLGTAALLDKPFEMEALADVLRDVLSRRGS
jgi:hypothetical protein